MAQEVKNDIKKALQVNTIPLIAIMTAVTTVLTMLVKIPTPIRGYLNLSDTMIYFSAYAFGPWVGGIIGGLGPALSDLISGYPQWAIFTFVIDGLQAVLVGLLVKKFNPANIIIGFGDRRRMEGVRAISSQAESFPDLARRWVRSRATPSRWRWV